MTKTFALNRGQELALGFLYWLTFLLVLEPGNVARAWAAGGAVAWDKEAIRILGASILGAMSTPVLLALMRRFPIEGGRLWRHATIQTIGGAAIAFGLIVLSCIMAPLMQVGDTRPFLVSLPQQVAANWLLLVFAIASFTAIAHALRRRGETTQAPAAGQAFLTTVPVKSRGRLVLLDLTAVDWIETQGNYLALHAGPAVHLIRETSVSFEQKLDPSRFVRTHRRTLVALDRVRELAPLAGGDAVLRLANGAELKVSRAYRERLRAALEERTTPAAPSR
jgi:hypothetical protein